MSVVTRSRPDETTADREQAAPRPADPLPIRPDRLFRMSLDQYHELGESGIFREARVELIEGVLFRKTIKSQPHILVTELLAEFLYRVVPKGWFPSLRNPITLEASGSEPEPDAKVVRGHPRDYLTDRRVGPADAALVIEVADSSVRDDQLIKKAIYARSSIPIYWLVNLPARRIEVYSDPTGPDPSPDYRRRADLMPGDQVPLVLDGREVARIAVADLLP